MAQTIPQASLYFLEQNEVYTREKPFYLDYFPPKDFPKSNLSLEHFHSLEIEDIRDCLDEFYFGRNGFGIVPICSDLSSDDFEDAGKVTREFLPLVAETIRRELGARRVQIYDWIVRKRRPEFPVCTGDFYNFKQPSSTAHVDATPEQTRRMLLNLNPEEGESLQKGRYQNVNLWKPLTGPVRDWPLTLCDPRTVDETRDLRARDTVRPDSYIETYQVHRRPGHKWYYCRDMQPNEAWLFLQSDSEGKMCGVPHTAFDNPLKSEQDCLRESVEVRSLVFYD